VLVVGTTGDYIDYLRNRRPNQSLFLTDCEIRRQAREPAPGPEEEALAPLADSEQSLEILLRFLERSDIRIEGVACFDCESMELASLAAASLGLSYPSTQAVRNCRDKYLTKTLWSRAGLLCPSTESVGSASEAIRFWDRVRGPCVLKPATGSGSELVFRADTPEQVKERFHLIEYELAQRENTRMFLNTAGGAARIVIEEMVEATEYSCDFIIEKNDVRVLRLARKLLADRGPLGTVLGYFVPASLPQGVEMTVFERTLLKSARCLGIERSICMLDFWVRDSEVILLELSPRPGGDCLPSLLRYACNMDILTMALDFAAGRRIGLEPEKPASPHVGLRLYAPGGGTARIGSLDDLLADNRVKEVKLYREQFHKVRMPPDDYTSWLLGHVIFAPRETQDIYRQCEDIRGLLHITMEE
jgi:biotin carboxylase